MQSAASRPSKQVGGRVGESRGDFIGSPSEQASGDGAAQGGGMAMDAVLNGPWHPQHDDGGRKTRGNGGS